MYSSIYSSRAMRERVVAERQKWDWPQPRPINRARARRELEERYKDVRGLPNKRGWVRVTRYRWDGEWGRWWLQYQWRERVQPKPIPRKNRLQFSGTDEQLQLFGKEV